MRRKLLVAHASLAVAAACGTVVVVTAVDQRPVPLDVGAIPLMRYGLPDLLKVYGEITNCFAQQKETTHVTLDPTNCIGYPKTPNKPCVAGPNADSGCWIYCGKHPEGCGPNGVSG